MIKRRPIIKILDAVHCKANIQARELILPFLKYKNKFYKKNFRGGKNIEKTCYLITGRKGTSGLLYTGLLPYLKKELKNKNIKIIGELEKFKSKEKINLKNIKYRKGQIKGINKFKKEQRGRLFFPTGYGKTLTIISIILHFINLRILYLCHTIDLIQQTSNEFNKYGIDHFVLNSKNKIDWKYLHKKDSCLLLSTIQSLSKVKKEKWMTFFDFIIVDEVHHATREKSQYGYIMQNILAPLRLGLSATKPTTSYERLINEGFFGPILSTITNQEGIAEGVLAKPIIDLIPIPYQTKINNKCKTYIEYRKYGITKNRIRNKLIINKTIENIKKGEYTLIIIENIEHGKILQKLFKNRNFDIPFIKGETKKEIKEKIRLQFTKLKNKTAICSKVWREGTDIPEINNIIYAAGLKEEKITIQAMGRGQRTTKNKTTVKLIDFLDPYKYLAEHCILRIQTYKKQGWL